MKFDRIHVIINPASGRERPILKTLNTIFHNAGTDWDVSITKASGDAARMAASAAAAGAQAVAVYGGDGTVAEVAAGLAGTDLPLAILPGGTANATAIAMGIPLELQAAAELLTGDQAAITPVDLGRIDHRHFLIAVGMGIPGALAEAADRESKDKLGFFAYALSTLQAVRNAQMAEYSLTLDGKEVASEGVMCVIANAGNFGIAGFSLAPIIDMTDGLLDVLVFRNADLNAILSFAATVVRQDEKSAPFERWQAREVTVVSRPGQSVQADGEVLDPGRVTASVLPCAARFIVPAPKE